MWRINYTSSIHNGFTHIALAETSDYRTKTNINQKREEGGGMGAAKACRRIMLRHNYETANFPLQNYTARIS